ncbi:MAG: serpin family protein [Candidatus Thermoplasmatota archaeon]|jgi:serpin B|nr:serpin family protein [Candidatus Thermoplasmatota archaeon]
MNKISLITIGVFCLIFIAGIISVVYFKKSEDFQYTTTPVKLADDSNYTAEKLSNLVDSINKFSFDFYQKISENKHENIFFSPYSIFVALSMAYEGACGNTAIQMFNILNFLQNDSETQGSFGRIYNLLNQKQTGYKISTANAFWIHQKYIFLPEYINLLQNYYMAEANKLDFSNNVEAASIINSWIENQTNGKIKDMIDPGSLSELTRLVLTNAIYFKGLWEHPFDPKYTSKMDFKINHIETVKVDMMSLSDCSFDYTETDDLQILKLPYKGKNLSMIVILPKENNLSIVDSLLNTLNIKNWYKNFQKTQINIFLPKFKFVAEYNLNNILKDMGMVDAFSEIDADFFGMDGTRSLFISDILHKAFVEVNEEGTEAAAATSVIVTTTAMTPTFNADHPFVFLIQHEDTGAILFMGKIINPVY